MRLYGFALLPQKWIQEQFVAFQNRYRDEIGGPVLGMDTNLPHTSILQCPYREDVCYDEYLQLAESAIESAWGEAYYQPSGWLFARVHRTSEMKRLHHALFEETKNLIDVSQIDQTRDLSGLNELEQRNYKSYGYRYLGSEYRPHVTLGRAHEGTTYIPLQLAQAFHKQFTGRTLRYDRIVFYEAGEYGALKRVISERSL